MADEANNTQTETTDTAAQAENNAAQGAQAALLDGSEGAGTTANDFDSGKPNDSGSGSGKDSETASVTKAELSSDYEQKLADRDAEIAELRAQIAEASKNAETADELNKKIAELEAKSEQERIDFELTLAGCRNTKAARALLDDHDGDVAELKANEPWLFNTEAEFSRGVTGLPNAGIATSDDATLKRWRELAGLDD